MSVTSTHRKETYAGDGSTAAFSVTFRYITGGQIRATRSDPQGVDTVLQEGVDYTLSTPNLAPGGTLTLIAGALPAGYTLTIERTGLLTQGLSLSTQGAFPPNSIEQALDQIIHNLQWFEARLLSDPATQAYVQEQIAGAIGAGQTVVPQEWHFTGDGSTDTFNITGTTGASPFLYVVAVDGLVQRANADYTIDYAGQQITFATPPGASLNVSVRNIGAAVNYAASDVSSVTARGSTTPRTLADRFAEVFNVQDFGAQGDGVTDDTNAFANCYAAAAAASPGASVKIPAGTYLANFPVITASYFRIRGSGAGVTVLKPYDKTKPVIQIGDGTTTVGHVFLQDLVLKSDGTGAGSDGLYIHGAHNVHCIEMHVEAFGRHNVLIDNSATQPTYFVKFSMFRSWYARGACLKLIQSGGGGSTYLTACYVHNFELVGNDTSGAHALHVDGIRLVMANGYVEIPPRAPVGRGHVYLGFTSSGGEDAHLQLFGVDIDAEVDNSGTERVDLANPESTIAIEINKTAQGRVTDYVFGVWTCHNYARWNSSGPTYTNVKKIFTDRTMNSVLNGAMLTGKMYFCRQDDFTETEDPDSAIQVYTVGAAGARNLRLDGGSVEVVNGKLKGIFDNTRPFQFSTNACKWRSAAGLMRYYDGAATPPGDDAGWGLLTRQAGVATISDTNTTATVTLPVAEPDAGYRVLLTTQPTGGTPVAGSTRAYVSSRTNTQFVITLEVAPDTGNTMSIDWLVCRT